MSKIIQCGGIIPTFSAAGAFSGHATLTTSLVSYWKLDEASSTRNDSHGSNHLTDNNTVTATTGKVGDAALFAAASSEYLSRADNASLSTGDIDFTITAWVYLTTDKNASRGIVSKYTATGEYLLYYVTGTDRFRFLNAGGATVTADTLGSPSLDTWYFICAWHDSVGNTVNIQVNNGTADSAAFASGFTDTTDAFNIGAYADGAAAPMQGRIDEVGFWKKVLTAQERTDLYNSGNGLTY